MNNRYKVWMWVAVLFFLISGGGFWVYWHVWGQFKESTKDAYVNGNMIPIAPFQEGIISAIFAENTQIVEAGQPLVQLDNHDFLIAFDKAAAHLANNVREAAQLFCKAEELKAKKASIEAELIRAKLDYEHRLALVADASVSREDFEHSKTTFASMQAQLVEAEKALEGILALIENTTIDTHPRVEQAKAGLRDAYLKLHRCMVVAPTRGLIGQRKVQVGQWVRSTDPLMALVPLDEMWVDANFRENELKYLRIGQPVSLISDMYGRDVEFHGRIVGLNPGTGSVFSILPPQNATGNWIKIVQRVPVKISLPMEEVSSHPLVLGLSMTVSVDTHNRSGKRLPEVICPRPIYQTTVYDDELEGAERAIEQILADNLP